MINATMKPTLREKIIITLPAYNAARTLKKVYAGIPRKLIDKIILVDDGSRDDTIGIARKLKIHTLKHSQNLGYGANQKTCYQEALKLGTDYIIMLHPDGQYDPHDLPKFINLLKSHQADLVLGSRFLESGDKETPFYKSLSIRAITFLFNLILGTNLTEANTGYRGFSRKFLATVPFHKNGNSYIFDPQIIIQAIYFGFKIAEVPVAKKYNPERSEPKLMASINHGLENLKVLSQYLLQRLRLTQVNFLTK